MTSLIVRGAPEEYICEIGAWDYLEEHLLKRQINKVLVLHGEKSLEVAESFLPKLKKIEVVFAHYQNECRYDIADQFIELVKEEKVNGIIGIGGGKVLDLAKLVADSLKIKSICLPTLASTCAAYTPVSIVYNNNHEMIEFKILSQSVSLTLIDPRILLNSPTEYLVAGIGDTLAKWYEAAPIISTIKEPSVEISVAHFAAKSCQENLMNYGEKAIQDLENKKLTSDFVKVVETNILLAGMVGGFGDKYGRTSGAHSIHDALTFIPKTSQILHGKKVAYGILVQLGIEEKWDEVKKLLPFYKSLGLPTKYSEMGILKEEMEKVADLASKDECMLLLPLEITTEKVLAAIESLEEL